MASKIEEFKETVEKDWAGDETAAAWQKHYLQMKEQLAEVTKALVDAADPKPGMKVLDLASGTGEPSLSIARRVAPSGTVLATDLSEGMLMALRHNAEAEGVTNIETQVLDAQELPYLADSFDLVTARFGVMFFAEIGRALEGFRRVLQPGGKAAFLVWGAPIPGSYFGSACMPYVKRMPEKPDPDGPGPMRFAEPGKLKSLMEAAGFGNVRESIQVLPTPFRGTPAYLMTSIMEIAAPLRALAESLPMEVRSEADGEARQQLEALYDGEFVRVNAQVLVVTGEK